MKLNIEKKKTLGIGIFFCKLFGLETYNELRVFQCPVAFCALDLACACCFSGVTSGCWTNDGDDKVGCFVLLVE